MSFIHKISYRGTIMMNMFVGYCLYYMCVFGLHSSLIPLQYTYNYVCVGMWTLRSLSDRILQGFRTQNVTCTVTARGEVHLVINVIIWPFSILSPTLVLVVVYIYIL